MEPSSTDSFQTVYTARKTQPLSYSVDDVSSDQPTSSTTQHYSNSDNTLPSTSDNSQNPSHQPTLHLTQPQHYKKRKRKRSYNKKRKKRLTSSSQHNSDNLDSLNHILSQISSIPVSNSSHYNSFQFESEYGNKIEHNRFYIKHWLSQNYKPRYTSSNIFGNLFCGYEDKMSLKDRYSTYIGRRLEPTILSFFESLYFKKIDPVDIFYDFSSPIDLEAKPDGLVLTKNDQCYNFENKTLYYGRISYSIPKFSVWTQALIHMKTTNIHRVFVGYFTPTQHKIWRIDWHHQSFLLLTQFALLSSQQRKQLSQTVQSTLKNTMKNHCRLLVNTIHNPILDKFHAIYTQPGLQVLYQRTDQEVHHFHQKYFEWMYTSSSIFSDQITHSNNSQEI